MLKAYVMVRSVPGMEKQVIDQVSNIPGVISVEGVYGEFDLVVRIEAPVGKTLDFVVRKIREVPGIKATKTIPSIRGERKSGSTMDYLGEPSD